ncbi:insulinase family protein [Heliobacterium chlorum]|uniref:Insulinase family protein n=1 Tax=Heliobacterium chlorum TaxID=2698 RepID=A0ABR7T8T0_HELCL|nr:insulinase family protein [Heliobacterium chlorum]MBC9786051.1 insulinase family protein [Heliobacterium chlorum]
MTIILKKPVQTNARKRRGLWHVSLLLIVIQLVLFITPASAATESNRQGSPLLSGFELVDERPVKDLNGIGKWYRHRKSGAQVFYLQNDDDNKVFSIGFRTPAPDDSGIPHIIEHSVFCGSRKYPVNDMLSQIQKGSVNTFANAFTTADKTFFPVASKNEKELRNLMDIYLDAVFHPNFYQSPEIFWQEGGHFELASPADEPVFNGIVYNEMKSHYTAVDNRLDRAILKSLFPDTPYERDAMGDPKEMPKLTRDKLLDYHRTYYHPSNSFIFLYGNLNIDDTLKFLDEEYLGDYDQRQINASIPLQRPFEKRRTVTGEYPLPNKAERDGNTYLSLNYGIDEPLSSQLIVTMTIVDRLLMGTATAPVKTTLLGSGIGKDSYSFLLADIQQPVYSIIAEKVRDDRIPFFESTVEKTLRNLVHQGIDREQLQTIIDTVEYEIRESQAGASRGLLYNQLVLNSWMNGGHPAALLEVGEALAKIKQGVSSGYFEQFIEEHLLNNPHSSLVTLKPDSAAEKEEPIKRSLSDSEKKILFRQQKELQDWQSKANSSESIPRLTLKEIDRQEQALPLEERTEAGVKVLFHRQFTNGIAYVDFYFDTQDVPQSQLPYLYLLAEMLGNVSTDHRNYRMMDQELHEHTGGLVVEPYVFSHYKKGELIAPKLLIGISAVADQLPAALELLGDMAGHSRFDDERRLQEILHQIRTHRESALYEGGESLALSRLQSFLSPAGRYEEQGGYSYSRFVMDADDHFDSKVSEIRRNLEQVAQRALNKDGLIVSVTSGETEYPLFQQSVGRLVSALNSQYFAPETYRFPKANKKEAFITASEVHVVAQGINYSGTGQQYNGHMEVLRNVLDHGYLWERLRMKGGAYDAFSQINDGGTILLGSVDDPNVKETIDVYAQTGEFLRRFQPDEQEMNSYIIGAIGVMDNLLEPWEKGRVAAAHYMRGIKQQDIQQIRDEILSTSPQDIRNFAPLLDTFRSAQNLTVVGNGEKIMQNQDCFDSVVDIFK